MNEFINVLPFFTNLILILANYKWIKSIISKISSNKTHLKINNLQEATKATEFIAIGIRNSANNNAFILDL